MRSAAAPSALSRKEGSSKIVRPQVRERAAPGRQAADIPFWCGVAATFTALWCAITSTTLWIDEGFSAWVAGHRTLSLALRTIAIGDVSDRQMPLHYVWLWVWSHTVGGSEYALRAANLPFAALFVVSIALVGRLVFHRRFGWIPFALSPFAWFYLNEGRAYFMLVSFATCSTAALLIHAYGPVTYRRMSAWATLAGLLGAMLTHMLAGFLAPAFLVIYLDARRRGAWSWRHWQWSAIAFVPPLLALAAFYGANLASTRTAYDYGLPSPGYFAVALYELAGFGGLGPPRNQLRGVDLTVFIPYLPSLVAGAAAAVFCLVTALRGKAADKARPLSLAFGASFLAAVAAAYAVNSRFLGRHVAALLPLAIFALMAWLPHRRQWIALGLIWMASDVRYRFTPAYGKDDYRSAVHDVVSRHSTEPGFIAWAADPLTANYYGLALTDVDRQRYYEFDYNSEVRNTPWRVISQGVIVENWKPDAARRLLESGRNAGSPVYLALSKPDLYDVHGGWQDMIASAKIQPAASYASFNIYVFR